MLIVTTTIHKHSSETKTGYHNWSFYFYRLIICPFFNTDIKMVMMTKIQNQPQITDINAAAALQENQNKSSQDSQSFDTDSFDTDSFDTDSFDSDNFDSDNGVALGEVLSPYFRPDELMVVCGALDEDKIEALAKAGVEAVINFQPEDELTFDEKSAVQNAGMAYEALPIRGAEDLKQLNILALDGILRKHHGKKIVMHCKSGNRVGAAAALRAGWLRGRKMDTAMARGRSHGLTGLEDEVYNRLLVPR